MLTIREVIKTFYNALLQRLKKHRGNWDQNDPSADDYIKNRPFYTDENEKTVIIPNQKVAFNSDRGSAASGGYTTIPLSPIIELVAGQSYDVVWDNKAYACTAHEFDGLAVVGNSSMMGGTDTKEPFFIAISKDYFGGAYIYADTAETHTVEVSTVKVVKLDKKYIPDLGLAPVATSGNYWDLEDLPTTYSDVVRYNAAQSLSDTQKAQARSNIGAVSSSEVTGVVKYTAQSLTEAQKQQARTNIGAVSSSEVTGVVKYSEQELTEEEKAQARKNIGSVELYDIEKAKDYIALVDQVNGGTYLISMQDGELVSDIGIQNIRIVKMPDKTDYMRSAYFDPTGMIVTATYQDGSVKEFENYTYTEGSLTLDTTSVDIVYKEAGIVHKETVPVTVSEFDPAIVLVDFTYTDNGDGTYTITGWKGTFDGSPSTEIIIPNYGCIIV